jgi:hypothetical protein
VCQSSNCHIARLSVAFSVQIIKSCVQRFDVFSISQFNPNSAISVCAVMFVTLFMYVYYLFVCMIFVFRCCRLCNVRSTYTEHHSCYTTPCLQLFLHTATFLATVRHCLSALYVSACRVFVSCSVTTCLLFTNSQYNLP